MEEKYTIGVDYGTLSARAAVIALSDGHTVAESVYPYPHAVMDHALPCGIVLPPDWALQHPQDYLDALDAVRDAVQKSGVSPDQIIGIGIDFTACTVLPVRQNGTPLCFLSEFVHQPHAYVKLWKHHGAQAEANEMTQIAIDRNENWLQRYGGKISSEWLFPKLLQILREAPEIYQAADDFIEAGDWIVWMLCGRKTRNACAAGYKAFWHKQTGYPNAAFFRALDPEFEKVVEQKLSGPVLPTGTCAGHLTSAMAQRLGLQPGIAIAVSNVDAHVAVSAVICEPGKMTAILGTSTCHMVLDQSEHNIPGICGYVEDGIIPGYFGYEAGQSCVGDGFAWFVKNYVPSAYFSAAKEENIDIQAYLTMLAAKLRPGESGLLALDWFNGNRSILVDVDLSGMILGLTLQTKPEEIYRALIEATAFGTRMIIDNFRAHGVSINAFYAAGGIAQKNPMMMQIYADVLQMPVYIAESTQCGALGSAILAAAAAGCDAGGYDSVEAANRKMAKILPEAYQPITENCEVYQQLYQQYAALHNYFGRGGSNVMKTLKALKFSLFKQ